MPLRFQGTDELRTVHAGAWIDASFIRADGDVGEDAGLVDAVAVLISGRAFD